MAKTKKPKPTKPTSPTLPNEADATEPGGTPPPTPPGK